MNNSTPVNCTPDVMQHCIYSSASKAPGCNQKATLFCMYRLIKGRGRPCLPSECTVFEEKIREKR